MNGIGGIWNPGMVGIVVGIVIGMDGIVIGTEGIGGMVTGKVGMVGMVVGIAGIGRDGTVPGAVGAMATLGIGMNGIGGIVSFGTAGMEGIGGNVVGTAEMEGIGGGVIRASGVEGGAGVASGAAAVSKRRRDAAELPLKAVKARSSTRRWWTPGAMVCDCVCALGRPTMFICSVMISVNLRYWGYLYQDDILWPPLVVDLKSLVWLFTAQCTLEMQIRELGSSSLSSLG